MGCCCSTEDSTGSETGEPNARTPLLGDAQTQASNVSLSGDSPTEPLTGAGGESRARADGETQLDSILQDMASAVIDVAAVDTQHLEQQDYVDRCQHYSGAVARLAAAPAPPPAVDDVPAPERLLAAPPAPAGHLRAARAFAERMQEAARQIQVVPHESLVIPFGNATSNEVVS